MPPATRSSRKQTTTTSTTSVRVTKTLRARRTTSISPSPLPETELATPESSTDDESMASMLPPVTLRGRNIEDLGELEEKGLLRRTSSLNDGDSVDDGVRRRGKDKESRLEKVSDGSEDEVTGLNNPRDRQAFALLVVLYLLQGIPLGLTFGTLPFLLKPHLSYSQLAIFALSTWPYSLKLLWSPIVDACFVRKWGRRKSWIVPVQGIVGLGLWIIGGRIEGWLEGNTVDVRFITAVFGCLILAAATQDIAVDGWALTLLSPSNLSYASTAQTIGLGIGSALSFTVFLAINSVDFSNKYFRSEPLTYGLVSLGGYMRFWAFVYAAVTVWLARFKTEDPVSEDDPDMDVRKVYSIMWSILRLKNIQSFLLVHLICKIGFQVNDSVTSLKLLEKGLSKEDLAVAVLLDFPAQMVAGWLAAKWSRPAPISRHPLTGASISVGTGQVLRPWIYAFWSRLIMATVATMVVWAFPRGEVGRGYFGIVIATTLFSSLTSTVQFVGITAFHTQIADPLIGGTYMTLLNTFSNLGGTWPKPLILRGVDLLSSSTCTSTQAECLSEHGKAQCSSSRGHCVVHRDGYYIMSAACVLLGVSLFVGFILPTVKRLQSLPMSAWRVKIPH
ncbi:MAG: hypothetical protein TREMPRED_005478 [Tremellales sp. Tagirdzhanova-0007]|nr:MAG: hypothetical protein TREMPRED_005478 [Tremellales sp. Tagirdzhanova-0007]